MLIKLQKKGTFLPLKSTITVYDRETDNVKHKESLLGETKKNDKYTVSEEIINEIKEYISNRDRLFSINKLKGADEILDGDIWKLVIKKDDVEYKLKAYSPWGVDENSPRHSKEEIQDIQLFVSIFEDIEDILVRGGVEFEEDE